MKGRNLFTFFVSAFLWTNLTTTWGQSQQTAGPGAEAARVAPSAAMASGWIRTLDQNVFNTDNPDLTQFTSVLEQMERYDLEDPAARRTLEAAVGKAAAEFLESRPSAEQMAEGRSSAKSGKFLAQAQQLEALLTLQAFIPTEHRRLKIENIFHAYNAQLSAANRVRVGRSLKRMALALGAIHTEEFVEPEERAAAAIRRSDSNAARIHDKSAALSPFRELKTIQSETVPPANPAPAKNKGRSGSGFRAKVIAAGTALFGLALTSGSAWAGSAAEAAGGGSIINGLILLAAIVVGGILVIIAAGFVAAFAIQFVLPPVVWTLALAVGAVVSVLRWVNLTALKLTEKYPRTMTALAVAATSAGVFSLLRLLGTGVLPAAITSAAAAIMPYALLKFPSLFGLRTAWRALESGWSRLADALDDFANRYAADGFLPFILTLASVLAVGFGGLHYGIHLAAAASVTDILSGLMVGAMAATISQLISFGGMPESSASFRRKLAMLGVMSAIGAAVGTGISLLMPLDNAGLGLAGLIFNFGTQGAAIGSVAAFATGLMMHVVDPAPEGHWWGKDTGPVAVIPGAALGAWLSAMIGAMGLFLPFPIVAIWVLAATLAVIPSLLTIDDLADSNTSQP